MWCVNYAQRNNLFALIDGVLLFEKQQSWFVLLHQSFGDISLLGDVVFQREKISLFTF